MGSITSTDRRFAADLHVHSTISDGSDTIADLIKKAEARGLYAIAIVEHDTLSHLNQIPTNTKIKVAAGIEISAVYRPTDTTAHILGYNISKPEAVTTITQPILKARNALSEKQVKIIAGLGYDISLNQLARADGKYLYKQHIMDWLYKTKQVPEMFGEFYKKTFKNGGVCDFNIEYTDVFKAVRAIKEAGGLAVLAHPGQQQNFWLIPKLTAIGLDGLELNHHANSAQDREIIKGYANKHGLFLTGGSDYHGTYGRKPHTIGDFLSEESGVKSIL